MIYFNVALPTNFDPCQQILFAWDERACFALSCGASLVVRCSFVAVGLGGTVIIRSQSLDQQTTRDPLFRAKYVLRNERTKNSPRLSLCFFLCYE